MVFGGGGGGGGESHAVTGSCVMTYIYVFHLGFLFNTHQLGFKAFRLRYQSSP